MIRNIAVAVFLVALITLILYGIYCLLNPKKKTHYSDQLSPASKYIDVPAAIGTAVVKYKYEQVPLRPVLKRGFEDYNGKKVRFQNTGEMEVYADDTMIGILEQPTICSVCREWLKTGEPYHAYVTKADNAEHKLAVSVMFYRDELARHLEWQPDAPEFKIMGMRGEDAQFAALDTYVGEELTLDLDPDKNRYALFNTFGDAVGYLSTSATKFIEEKGEDVVTLFVSDKQTVNGITELRFRVFY